VAVGWKWEENIKLEDAELEWVHYRNWRLLDKDGRCWAMVYKNGDYSNEYTAIARPWGLPEDTFSQEFTAQGIPTEALDMAEKVVTG